MVKKIREATIGRFHLERSARTKYDLYLRFSPSTANAHKCNSVNPSLQMGNGQIAYIRGTLNEAIEDIDFLIDALVELRIKVKDHAF